MAFRITGLPLESFRALLGAEADIVAAAGACRVIAESDTGYPCRITLEDARAGESLLLLPYVHHAVAGPYRASGPIYVRERAAVQASFRDLLPPVLQHRLLSVRGYDEDGWMQVAQVTQGEAVTAAIHAMLDDPRLAYLHIHNAGPGCYSCRVDRD